MSKVIGSLVLGALLLAVSAPVLGAETAAAPKGATIQANVINMEPGAFKRTARLIVTLDRFTPDEELAGTVDAFRAGGQSAMVALWQKEEPVVGRMRFANTLGYDIRVARIRDTETGRKLTLVTDRPIGGFEVMGSLRSEDYPIGWIEIELDKKGKGSGKMIPAAQLRVEDGSLVMESFGTQPMRLQQVSVKIKNK